MKRPINNEIHLGQTVDPADNTQKVKSVNYSSDFNGTTEKMVKKVAKAFEKWNCR